MEKKVRQTPNMCSKIVRKLNQKLRSTLNISTEYQYGDFSIELPPNHMLPSYQRFFPKYDRFLPHLARYIKDSDAIVDIGANVGDTLAGMVEQNVVSNYICIEPDDFFYQHLVSNIEKIKKARPGLKVHAIKALVGQNVSGVSLEGKLGTKHAVISHEGGIESKPLDGLLSDMTNYPVRLIKTDVDGFDYDVLDSSALVIRKYRPMIFFELQYEHEYQKNGYTKTLRYLESEGYCDWVVFDNFGEVITRVNSIDVVIQLMDYLWKQNTGCAKRTIFYYDVLAVQNSDSELVDCVLADY